ncbi:response regulator transcription factor [Streptomyces venezuelae]|uniref:Helix-turn-helix transcriptional regulator n=1 Tax=Streptomyces venezuelae TaxID=54571 RepID=A0A5P2CAM7_STRVZ|nr:response regulator transcription factor [Streptomyces venezuelae]QES39310.1 helix-turn-helix transcriptional regulator [Streptomyces venezuelae]
MIRVLLVHDACLLRMALAEQLAREPDLEVFHSPWSHARGRQRNVRPDLCVVDLDDEATYAMAPLGELTGPSALGRGCRVLVLATANRPGQLRRAAEADALGYVNKASPPERLLAGIRQVAAGQRFVDESLGFGFLKAAQMPLTRRELSVLSLAAGGASVAEIANSLHLSNGTVRNYMAAITRKTGARNRIDAIRISQGEGWV